MYTPLNEIVVYVGGGVLQQLLGDFKSRQSINVPSLQCGRHEDDNCLG